MYAKSTLQKSSFIHPNGMLDRDQRTIITISLRKSREKYGEFKKFNYNLKLNSIPIRNCTNFSENFKQQNNNKVFCEQYLINNDDECDIMSNETKNYATVLPSSLSILKHKNIQLINNKNHLNQNQYDENLVNLKMLKEKSSNKRINNHFRFLRNLQFTKLNSLIFCICLWLFISQKTRAVPLRMSEENNNYHHSTNHHHHHHRHHINEEPIKCSDVRDVIDKILRQANVSYELNYAKLENFTQTLFKEHHQDYHNEWRHRHLDWLYPNKKQLNIDDYDKQVPDDVLQHLRNQGAPTRAELSRELTDLFIRLKILAMAVENIRADHNKNLYELMSRYPNEKHVHIVDYFKEQDRYIRALLTETESAMKKLSIATPDYIVDNDGIKSYQGLRDLRDWIVTREHLKLLHYVLKAYEIILNRCS